MSGMTTANMDVLIRSELWSGFLKDILEDELMASKYVQWLSEFPDGNTFTIPRVGQLAVRDYVENEPVKYDALDTGEFQFTITEYLSSATYITKKARQDAFYASMVEASFVPKQARAIAEHVETTILALQSQQTGSDPNALNGADHRLIASGTNEVMALADFAKALYALKKANVPQANLVAIVDPSVEYTANVLSNLVNVSNNPKWEGIVATGIGNSMTFMRNIYGFDVYTSNYLADVAAETITATGGASDSVADGKANLFFSATSGMLPFIGAWRQTPTVDGEWNKDRQREEYMTTARYGVKLYWPDNLVVVLSEIHI